jgi:hypothetical protein
LRAKAAERTGFAKNKSGKKEKRNKKKKNNLMSADL